MCVCVCVRVSVCEKEREREKERDYEPKSFDVKTFVQNLIWNKMDEHLKNFQQKFWSRESNF